MDYTLTMTFLTSGGQKSTNTNEYNNRKKCILCSIWNTCSHLSCTGYSKESY